MTDEGLDRKILKSSGWVAVSYGGRSVLAMLSTLALVRLLEPKAFGLVALATMVLLVLEYVQSSGIGTAVVYKRDDAERTASSAFVFAGGAGLLLAIALATAAPLLAWALRAPGLTDVLRALSALLLLRGLSVVPEALLEQALDFRSRAQAELAAGVVQIGVSVGMAVAGAGVWSLVGGQLGAGAVQAAIVWLRVPWRPSRRHVSLPVLRGLMSYGRFVSAGNILGLVNSTIDNVVVGRMLGPALLGFYAVTYRLADMPTAVVGHVVGRVMFPAYAHLQDDPAAFRRAFVQTLQRVSLFSLPLSVGLAVGARPIVAALLGPSWLGMVPTLRILAVFGLVRAFAATCGPVFQAAGKPHLVPLWAIPHTVVVIPALVVLVPRYHVAGAAAAMLAAMTASALPVFVTATRLLGLRVGELVSALAPTVASSAILGIAMAALLPVAGRISPPAGLALLAAAGLLVYAIGIALLARQTVVPMWVTLRSR